MPGLFLIPEELVEVSVLHVLEHHDEGVALHTHAVEGDDVLVLQVGQQLGFTMEVFACVLAGFLKGLYTHNVQTHNTNSQSHLSILT